MSSRHSRQQLKCVAAKFVGVIVEGEVQKPSRGKKTASRLPLQPPKSAGSQPGLTDPVGGSTGMAVTVSPIL